MVGERDGGVRTPAFLASDAIVGQRLHPRVILGNTRQKSANFGLFGRIESASCLVERVFHAATLATFLEFHAVGDFIERRRGLCGQTFQNFRWLEHLLTQSCLRFFQLHKAPHATPVVTDGYASGDSVGVSAKTGVGIRLNLGK
jgi:hypothetical protein